MVPLLCTHIPAAWYLHMSHQLNARCKRLTSTDVRRMDPSSGNDKVVLTLSAECSIKPATKKPVKQSPAPVVSMTGPRRDAAGTTIVPCGV